MIMFLWPVMIDDHVIRTIMASLKAGLGDCSGGSEPLSPAEQERTVGFLLLQCHKSVSGHQRYKYEMAGYLLPECPTFSTGMCMYDLMYVR